MNRKQSKLKQRPSVGGVILLLESCKEKIRYYSLFVKSKIYFKKSFIFYLNWCVERRLIINSKILGKKNTTTASWFVITKKGREFLELVSLR